MKIQIAIDGPSGSGKSSLAKRIAKLLGLVYVDTGALYRTVGLLAQRNGIERENASAVVKILGEHNVSLTYTEEGQRVLLDGEDVSDLIRTGEISMYASAVSAVPQVRKYLLELQKKIAANGNVIMDGRDIGTVIMPDADVKIFMEASAEARAHRRYLELVEKGETCSEEEVLKDIIKRDRNDETRSASPLVPADDAIFLDNSNIDLDGTVQAALEIINAKINRTEL